jgi:phenylalanyl-tRNA synthetase alpha chain
MVRKGIVDIRLLRVEEPRIARQMLELTPYLPVSRHPPLYRALSLAIDEAMDAETLGGRIREVLGDYLAHLESSDVVTETPAAFLSAAVQSRRGIRPGHKNVLLRLGIRDPARPLPSTDANALCHRVFLALHQGGASAEPRS